MEALAKITVYRWAGEKWFFRIAGECCISPNRCADIKRISLHSTQALRLWMAGWFVARRKMLAEKREPCLVRVSWKRAWSSEK